MHSEDDVPDLDLLRCFLSLHRERHLSRAAMKMGLSQPAMSRALGRLRQSLGDPLFVRTPTGMLPTARADELAPRVQQVIEAASALTRPATFDPGQLSRTFVIGTSGFVDAQLLPALYERLAARAPGVSLATQPIGDDMGGALASGRIDLMISIGGALPKDVRRVRLYEESFVCAVRRKHPRIQSRLTLPAYVALSHLLVAPAGNPGSRVDSALAALGHTRRVAVRVHAFAAAPGIVASSDLILTAPRRLIEPLAKPFGLRLLPPPLELAPFPIYCAWHPRFHDEPAHAWFRAEVLAAGA